MPTDVSSSVDMYVQATSIFISWKGSMWEGSFSAMISE